ncbi:hypothetical protein [Arthrobacter sp. B1805]|uniref:hypothetical protein n=1 Tax=Arthrobacter sp. B1805 TaxID=2058892 RepID=UPI000CE36C3C|nr:hypothetical protein [Arthrobacter sp. B1805]
MSIRAAAEQYATNDVGLVLEWVLQEGDGTSETPPWMSEYDRLDMNKILISAGLIHKEQSAAGEWTLSTQGRKIAEELAAGRKPNGWLRRQLIIRAMLRWIDEEEPRFVADFVGQLVDGVEVTEPEVNRALKYLKDHDLVTGNVVGDTLMTPRLTALGDRVGDHDALPQQLLDQTVGVTNDHSSHIDQSNNVNVQHSNVGAVSAGNNVVQSGNSVSAQETEELLELIKSMREQLAARSDAPPSSDAKLDALEEAASAPSADRSHLKELLGAFLASIGTKLAESSWAGVVKSVAMVAAIIGL